MVSRTTALILAALATIAGSPATAWSAPGMLYRLDPGAELQAGCFPPCLCPVLIRTPVQGTFTLLPAGSDGSYQQYEVLGLEWFLTDANGQTRITGNGTYRVGGEVTAQHRLTLELAVGGEPARTYESGLVPGGREFPKIDIDVALHGFFCHDSAYRVQASPSVAAVEAPVGGARLRPAPNPFESRTGIDFAVTEAGPVHAWVRDLTGRRVRTLAAGERYAAGTHTLVWDGTRDDGREAGAGIYFLTVRAADRVIRGPVIKVRPAR